MDFGNDNWDVTTEAEQLHQSLFEGVSIGFLKSGSLEKGKKRKQSVHELDTTENGIHKKFKEDTYDQILKADSERKHKKLKQQSKSSKFPFGEKELGQKLHEENEFSGKERTVERGSVDKKIKKKKKITDADKSSNHLVVKDNISNSEPAENIEKKGKKKRKRKCRKNKFKDYSKSGNGDGDNSSNFESSQTIGKTEEKKGKRKCEKNKFKDYSKSDGADIDVKDDECGRIKISYKRKVVAVNNDNEMKLKEKVSTSNNNSKLEIKQKEKKKKEVQRGTISKSFSPKTVDKEDSMKTTDAISVVSDDSKNSKLRLISQKKKKSKAKKANPFNDSSVASSGVGNVEETEFDSPKHSRNQSDQQKQQVLLNPNRKQKAMSYESQNEFESNRSEIGTDRPKTETASAANSLLEKSLKKLNAARFRYLNEQLYTRTGSEAFQMFQNDKETFQVYHNGFQGQVEKWPVNPLDLIICSIKSKPKSLVIADFGCGDAKLAQNVSNKVHSFDLVALNHHVTVCDMTEVPLKDSSVDIAVFCLSLMGTDVAPYLREANRVLKQDGILKIAEVTSRFRSIGKFIHEVKKIGFEVINQDSSNKMFVMMDFKKTGPARATSKIILDPCLYKKR